MEQLSKELHKPFKKKFKTSGVRLKEINEIYGADLVEMREWSEQNDGYNYILNIIDCFSKFVWSYPLKDKKAVTVAKIFNELFEDGNVPKRLWTDQGKEFYNKDVNKILKQYDVQIYSTFGNAKSAIVERFNRTLKTNMWKKFSELQTRRWVEMLDDLIDDYHNTVHRSIGMKPIDVTKSDEKEIRKKLKVRNGVGKIKFKVGDKVRISRLKGIFEKGYLPNWSHEVFDIVKIIKDNPVRYKLKDITDEVIEGSFYTEELQKTKLKNMWLIQEVLKTRTRNGKKELYVKWLGMNKKFNRWIDEDDIIEKFDN